MYCEKYDFVIVCVVVRMSVLFEFCMLFVKKGGLFLVMKVV